MHIPYVYLAATRLSLYHSPEDWAIVIEIFGFSPRTGIPDTHISTFASQLYNRQSVDDYVSPEAYDSYLSNNPHNESRFIFPIEEGDWLDSQDIEFLADGNHSVNVRGKTIPFPAIEDYENHGIILEEAPRIKVFEFCRLLAAIARNDVLANPSERRGNVLPEMRQIMQLEQWSHPDVVNDESRPSGSETFQQLAQVLVTGDIDFYQPTTEPNTHWSNWPDGGSL